MNCLTPTLPFNPVIDVYKKDVDRTRVRENLQLSYDERLVNLMRLQEFAEELQTAGRRARRERV